jgi:hypothetical protein
VSISVEPASAGTRAFFTPSATTEDDAISNRGCPLSMSSGEGMKTCEGAYCLAWRWKDPHKSIGTCGMVPATD